MRRPALLIVSALLLAPLHVGCSGSGTVDTSSSGSGGSSTSSSSSAGGGGASSSSASSSASSGGGGTGGATSSSSSGGGGPEICTDGIDNDGDGHVDCEDPDCDAGFTCTVKAPPPWNGPVALYDGDPALAPSCPPEQPMLAYQGNAGLVQAPAICSPCTCSAPNVSCTLAPLVLGDAQCGQGVSATQQPPGMCGSIIPPPGTAGYTAAPPELFVGSCSPSAVITTLPLSLWSTTGLTCATSALGTGCVGMQVCSARPIAPFEPSLCVYQAGDHPCPQGYPQKHLYIDSVIDTRGCDSCLCGAGAGTCTATTTVHTDGACASASFTVPNDGSCVAGGQGSSILTAMDKSGSCPVAGGQPHGAVAPGLASTSVCCTP